MRYMGGKHKIANDILKIILQNRIDENHLFIDLFCGGCNVVKNVTGNRLANDINHYVIDMFKAIVYDNWIPPEYITRKQWYHIKDNKHLYSNKLIGWAGTACSFNGVFFKSFSGKNFSNRDGFIDFQKYSFRQMIKEKKFLKGIDFQSHDYKQIGLINNPIVYCDIPYKNTESYFIKFNHEEFYQYIRKNTNKGLFFISEIDMPDDFICIWEKEILITIDRKNANLRKECLFIHESQKDLIKY